MSFDDTKGAYWLWDLVRAVSGEIAGGTEYALLETDPSERYGSFDVTLARAARGAQDFDRFIVFSVLPRGLEGRDDPTCHMEVWAGAESKVRFGRYLVATGDAVDNEGITRFALATLEPAFRRADALSDSDLTEFRSASYTRHD